MLKKGNPIPDAGERNVLCPHYNHCLDRAVKLSWQSWSCSQCQNRFVKQREFLETTLNRECSYFELPERVWRVVHEAPL
jgi:hypothetical protein